MVKPPRTKAEYEWALYEAEGGGPKPRAPTVTELAAWSQPTMTEVLGTPEPIAPPAPAPEPVMAEQKTKKPNKADRQAKFYADNEAYRSRELAAAQAQHALAPDGRTAMQLQFADAEHGLAQSQRAEFLAGSQPATATTPAPAPTPAPEPVMAEPKPKKTRTRAGPVQPDLGYQRSSGSMPRVQGEMFGAPPAPAGQPFYSDNTGFTFNEGQHPTLGGNVNDMYAASGNERAAAPLRLGHDPALDAADMRGPSMNRVLGRGPEAGWNGPQFGGQVSPIQGWEGPPSPPSAQPPQGFVSPANSGPQRPGYGQPLTVDMPGQRSPLSPGPSMNRVLGHGPEAGWAGPDNARVLGHGPEASWAGPDNARVLGHGPLPGWSGPPPGTPTPPSLLSRVGGAMARGARAGMTGLGALGLGAELFYTSPGDQAILQAAEVGGGRGITPAGAYPQGPEPEPQALLYPQFHTMPDGTKMSGPAMTGSGSPTITSGPAHLPLNSRGQGYTDPRMIHGGLNGGDMVGKQVARPMPRPMPRPVPWQPMQVDPSILYQGGAYANTPLPVGNANIDDETRRRAYRAMGMLP